MSETFTLALKAGPNTRYARGAYNRQVGSTTRVKLPGSREVEGVIRSAVVSEDGSEVEVTVEVPDGTLPPPSLKGHSIAPG
jgi:hypothetical protein